eukprot:CAMPEP_0198139718 /NCGR_PEP_ID=MMETSP1443-20131203/2973_1 /TAXON_ID=186043 /ORGANISM="Entomoneis sp., Strain CCMP2396" /LENGTH=160 /DNA_ID=CAMNT_0043801921 /DNA_START=130 /DNA_END=612 /DNA_ORIENTATION=+
MTVTTMLGITLMVASQSLAWYLLSNDSKYRIYRSVCGLSTFYATWALYLKFFDGRSGELGMYSMGLLAICSFFEKRIPSICASGVVMLNFSLAIYGVFPLGCEEFAEAVHRDMDPHLLISIWCITFKTYLISSLCFWGFAAYKMIKLHPTAATTTTYTEV